MPKGPKGEKRPADVIGKAILVANIVTGEEPEEQTNDGVSAWQHSGHVGLWCRRLGLLRQ